MLDALFPTLIPLEAILPGDLIAAYVGHSSNPESFDQAVQEFGSSHQVVSIAAKTHHDAQILDVEHGAVEPTDYPTMNAWCVRQRARGVFPTIYANSSTWPTVKPHIVGAVNWWAANWSHGPTIPAGAVGVQYTGHAGYDISVMNDFIAGIDSGDAPSGGGTPIPTPTPIPVPEDTDMSFRIYQDPRSPAVAAFGGNWRVDMNDQAQIAVWLSLPDCLSKAVEAADQTHWDQLQRLVAYRASAPAGVLVPTYPLGSSGTPATVSFPGYTGTVTLTPEAT